jgi:hypothetical protein
VNDAAIHLAIDNFPPVLNLAGLCLLAGGLSARSVAVTRAALIVLLSAATIAVPVYVSGNRAADIVRIVEGIDKPAIEPHQEAGLASLIFLVVQSVVAFVALITRRRAVALVVVLFSLAATLTLFYTADLGRRIHHPEIHVRHG